MTESDSDLCNNATEYDMNGEMNHAFTYIASIKRKRR
jgi:hypothetical protein